MLVAKINPSPRDRGEKAGIIDGLSESRFFPSFLFLHPQFPFTIFNRRAVRTRLLTDGRK